jgi:hypothetical protein
MSLIAGILYFILNMLYIEKYSKHQRKGTGLDLTNIKGDRHAREQDKKNGSGQLVIGSDPSEKYYDGGGYIGPCDVNKFTDVPLDEETPETNAKFIKNENKNSVANRNKNNNKNNKSIANSSV